MWANKPRVGHTVSVTFGVFALVVDPRGLVCPSYRYQLHHVITLLSPTFRHSSHDCLLSLPLLLPLTLLLPLPRLRLALCCSCSPLLSRLLGLCV